MQRWVDRLVEATRWQPRQLPLAWEVAEAKLGVLLPSDYKELCETFGEGEFNEYAQVFSSADGRSTSVSGKLAEIREVLAEHPPARRLYEPYGLFECSGSGLIPWGESVTEGQFYWLADASAGSESWKVVAREDPLDPWHVFDISMSEFLFRMLTDMEFQPFSIATGEPAYFEPS